MTVQIETIEGAVEYLRLVRVSFYEQAAKRSEIDLENASLQRPPGDEAEMKIWTAFRSSSEGIDYRCSVTLNFEQASITADAAISYRSEVPVNLARKAIIEFGNGVAIMTLFPYLRQAISDLGARIGYESTLPMITPGQIRFQD